MSSHNISYIMILSILKFNHKLPLYFLLNIHLNTLCYGIVTQLNKGVYFNYYLVTHIYSYTSFIFTVLSFYNFSPFYISIE
jgi:hypothetical protein